MVSRRIGIAATLVVLLGAPPASAQEWNALQKFLAAEMARWGKVVKDNNIRPE